MPLRDRAHAGASPCNSLTLPRGNVSTTIPRRPAPTQTCRDRPDATTGSARLCSRSRMSGARPARTCLSSSASALRFAASSDASGVVMPVASTVPSAATPTAPPIVRENCTSAVATPRCASRPSSAPRSAWPSPTSPCRCRQSRTRPPPARRRCPASRSAGSRSLARPRYASDDRGAVAGAQDHRPATTDAADQPIENGATVRPACTALLPDTPCTNSGIKSRCRTSRRRSARPRQSPPR